MWAAVRRKLCSQESCQPRPSQSHARLQVTAGLGHAHPQKLFPHPKEHLFCPKELVQRSQRRARYKEENWEIFLLIHWPPSLAWRGGVVLASPRDLFASQDPPSQTVPRQVTPTCVHAHRSMPPLPTGTRHEYPSRNPEFSSPPATLK